MTSTILRLRAVLHERGRSRSAHYKDIQQGLFTRPVAIGLRAVGWPWDGVTCHVKGLCGDVPQEPRRCRHDKYYPSTSRRAPRTRPFRSAHYKDIQQGLFTRPVAIGLRAVGCPRMSWRRSMLPASPANPTPKSVNWS